MIWAIIQKEWMQLRRDPRLIGLMVVMPIVLLLLFGFALRLEPRHITLAIVDQDHSFFSSLIRTGLWNDGHFDLVDVPTQDDILHQIRSGKAKAGLFIPATFTSELVENQQPHITFYVDGTMPSLTTSMKYHSGAAASDEVKTDMVFSDPDQPALTLVKDPFIMDTTILFNPDEKETWFFLPGIVGVLVMQVSLILTGISIVREREKRTLEQLLSAPISKSSFILGKLIPYILIALIDFYVILGIGWAVFDLPQPASHLALFSGGLLFVSVMISVGLFISLISKTQQQAMFMAIFILIPSVLLSGFIFPLEAIPIGVRVVAYLIPFTYFIDIMRGILIKHTELTDLAFSYLALCIYLVVFVFISIKTFKTKL